MTALGSFAVLAGAAFVAGAVSVASPCVLPLVPAYLAAAMGTKAPAVGRPHTSRRMDLLAATSFVAGFCAVFVGLGAFAAAVSSIVPAPTQPRVAGLILCAVGLSGLGLLPAIDLVRLLGRATNPQSSSFLLGALFAVAATPAPRPCSVSA